LSSLPLIAAGDHLVRPNRSQLLAVRRTPMTALFVSKLFQRFYSSFGNVGAWVGCAISGESIEIPIEMFFLIASDVAIQICLGHKSILKCQDKLQVRWHLVRLNLGDPSGA